VLNGVGAEIKLLANALTFTSEIYLLLKIKQD
jgi:hypothetical protein